MAPDAARIPDAKAVLPLITRGMSILATVGLGLSLVTSVCAPWVVPLLFGARYHDAVPLILILTWSNVFVFVGCFHALYLVSVNRQDVSLRLSWVTASCSLGLNLLLIPRWHAIGAAFAALAAYAITTTFGVVLFTASRPLWRANWIAYIAPFRFLQQNLARRKDSANIES
jgi:O-antigen/teichoic acid export membrane protein